MVDVKVDFSAIILRCFFSIYTSQVVVWDFLEPSTVWLYVLSYHKINQMWII